MVGLGWWSQTCSYSNASLFLCVARPERASSGRTCPNLLLNYYKHPRMLSPRTQECDNNKQVPLPAGSYLCCPLLRMCLLSHLQAGDTPLTGGLRQCRHTGRMVVVVPHPCGPPHPRGPPHLPASRARCSAAPTPPPPTLEPAVKVRDCRLTGHRWPTLGSGQWAPSILR